METHSRTPNELDAGTRLSVHRTELALEGALLSIDKAEMSVLTTSLSLIGFGFTIFKFFQEVGAKAGRPDVEGAAARNFGLYLLILGMFLLVAGLYNRFRNVRLLKRRWQILYDEGLIVSPPMRTISPNMVVSILLVLGGALVILGIAAHVGPFG